MLIFYHIFVKLASFCVCFYYSYVYYITLFRFFKVSIVDYTRIVPSLEREVLTSSRICFKNFDESSEISIRCGRQERWESSESGVFFERFVRSKVEPKEKSFGRFRFILISIFRFIKVLYINIFDDCSRRASTIFDALTNFEKNLKKYLKKIQKSFMIKVVSFSHEQKTAF